MDVKDLTEDEKTGLYDARHMLFDALERSREELASTLARHRNAADEVERIRCDIRTQEAAYTRLLNELEAGTDGVRLAKANPQSERT